MKDLLIIGAGPAGYEGAIRASQLGFNVTVIEKGELGGTCLNIGCVPTKCLLYDMAKNRDIKAAYKRKNEVVSKLVRGIGQLFKGHNIKLIKGTASFLDENTVEILETGERLTFTNLLLATGSSSFIPKTLFIDGFTVDSDYLLNTTELFSKKIAIIGGGVIGIEASFILGPENVVIIEKLPQILPNEDSDMLRYVEKELKKRGAKIYTDNGVSKIEQGKITLEKGEELFVDKALVVVGRKANTTSLNLEKAGVKVDSKGFVLVDSHFKTTNSNIYAVGDIVGQSMLAHYASSSAKNLVEHLAGKEAKIALNVVPSVVYSTPELARVGKTEKELKENNIQYKLGKFMYGANAKALASEETGVVKVISDYNGKILGASIVGHGAEDMISIFSLVMANGGSMDDIHRTIFPHPTLSEMILEAAEDVDGMAIHKVKR